MFSYDLHSTIRTPGMSATFIEFSQNGRFLAVGDQGLASLWIFDKTTGFSPNIVIATPATPTALVWETSETVFAGFDDGRLVHYRVDLVGKTLVEGAVNSHFHNGLPITAMALDAKLKTLVVCVGPEVFVVRRICIKSMFFVNKLGQ